MKQTIKQVLNDYFKGQINIEEYENVLEDDVIGLVKPDVYVVDAEDIEILANAIAKAVSRKEQ